MRDYRAHRAHLQSTGSPLAPLGRSVDSPSYLVLWAREAKAKLASEPERYGRKPLSPPIQFTLSFRKFNC